MFIVRLQTFDEQRVATAEKRCWTILWELAKIIPRSAQPPPAPAHISPPERAARRAGPVMNYSKVHSLWEIWMVQEGWGSQLQRQIAFTAS